MTTLPLKNLEENYGIDLINDVYLDDGRHILFYVDLNEKARQIYIISGDLTLFDLPDKKILSFKEFATYIEPHNPLSEVEGRETFLSDIEQRLSNIDDTMYLYIPIKRDKSPLWLMIDFQNISLTSKDKLLLGRVNHVIEDTPKEIIYYRKTHQDPLTKLFTRETLKKHLDYIKEPSGDYGLYIDLDGFKQYNDKFGHQAGDDLLIRIANHFINRWERNVLYYRLGGDEFFSYVFDYDKENVLKKAGDIIKDIQSVSQKQGLRMGASVGIVPITESSPNVNRVLDLSDLAMYESKANGGSTVTLKEGDQSYQRSFDHEINI